MGTIEQPRWSNHQGASIEDVAEAADVSTATVSRALRGLPRVSKATRERVLETARTLGYKASPTASALASGRTRTIGVLALSVNRWFYSHALDGIASELHDRNYNVALFHRDDFGSALEPALSVSALRRRVDGVVLLARESSPRERRQLIAIDVPTVSVGCRIPGLQSVAIDDQQATADAINHLVGLGHRRIALLHGGIQPAKVAAFLRAMTEAGLDVRPEWIQRAELSLAGGRTAVARLWDLPGKQPTAVLCASDEMAMGALREAARIGIRVPTDLSIIGMDDHDFSESYGITTIRQSPRQQARLGIKMLLDEPKGKPGAIPAVIVPHRLVVRGTTFQAPS